MRRECRFKRSLRVNEAPQWQAKGFSFVSAILLISFTLFLGQTPTCRRLWSTRGRVVLSQAVCCTYGCDCAVEDAQDA